MAVAVDDTIPADWMNPQSIHQVVVFIRQLRIRPKDKRAMLARWAYMAGAEVPPEYFRYVQLVDQK